MALCHTYLTQKANAATARLALCHRIPDEEGKCYQSKVGEQQEEKAEGKAVLPHKVELEGVGCSKGQ